MRIQAKSVINIDMLIDERGVLFWRMVSTEDEIQS